MALNLQGFRFSDSYRYSIVDDSYKEKYKGKYVASSSLSFSNSPFYTSNKSVTQVNNEIINYQYVLTAGATYYYNPNLALGLDLNAINGQVLGKDHNSLADTILKARWNLYRTSQYSFSLNPKIFLPTGKINNFSTINSLGASVSGVGEYAYKDWHFLGSLGYFHGDNNQFSIVDYRNLILLNLAASYDINPAWNVNAEAVKNFTTNRAYREDEGGYFVTFKNKSHERFGTYFGGGLAGFDHIDRNHYTLFAGVKIHQ
jgi:hypothetical protein